ncbi:flavin reductase [Octadecabacter ascidiaceicola]|uniref:FMN reductase (NADH) NtaB n=1 Tax=Octadecabacter ascidiaceicola TaxID=1655543 RepID=A0A238KI02_9RHOB|nr:flavin reductase family protein [Octadecabacter ascidiaceicola]SMX42431.1 FMN reductase (NADH) NtaB [Octadecabacter ascidiaceicola]
MTGVTVVTSRDVNGTPIGFTANSFTSVSLDPPMVLVCVANTSRNLDTLVKATGFAVNILAEDQIDVSNTFARPVEDRFASVNWHKGSYGTPILAGVTAWFDCSMHKTVIAGDHTILIGQVEEFETTATPGLGYVRGAYVTPSTTAEAIEPSANLVVSALIERNGEVLLLDDGKGGLALPEQQVTSEGVSTALAKLIASTGLMAEPGFVYSVFEDVKHQHISFMCQTAEGEPTKGAFVPMTATGFAGISDPAILSMLKRFATESPLGNFGMYYGDQYSGEVRPVLKEK